MIGTCSPDTPVTPTKGKCLKTSMKKKATRSQKSHPGLVLVQQLSTDVSTYLESRNGVGEGLIELESKALNFFVSMPGWRLHCVLRFSQNSQESASPSVTSSEKSD